MPIKLHEDADGVIISIHHGIPIKRFSLQYLMAGGDDDEEGRGCRWRQHQHPQCNTRQAFSLMQRLTAGGDDEEDEDADGVIISIRNAQ